MKKVIVIFLTSIFLFTSCKKNDNDSTQSAADDYTPMEVGYFWVYDWIKTDSLGNESPMNITDSIHISKDTIINGYKFFKFEGTMMNNPTTYYLRDSNDYLINSEGNILFSSTNFNDILEIDTIEPVAVVHYKMNHKDSLVSVPFGSFTTYDYEGTVYPNNSAYPHGIMYLHTFYGKRIGQIKSTTYFFSAGPAITMDRRLVDTNLPVFLSTD